MKCIYRQPILIITQPKSKTILRIHTILFILINIVLWNIIEKQKLCILFIYIIFLLACYPFEGQDPFIIKEMPDVFFVSNQQSFQTALKKNINGNIFILITIHKNWHHIS